MFEPMKDDCYTCPKCSLTPKIITLYRNTIQLECPTHGHMSMDLEAFMEESSKRIYLNQTCGICNKSKQSEDQNIFKYCYDCDKVICYQCINSHQKNFGSHIKLIPADLLTSKCNIHKGEDFIEFCFTCKKNICKLCSDEHQDHDTEKLEGFDEDILEGDLSLIEARKQYLDTVLEKILKEAKEINNCIKFYDLITKTQKKYGKNGFHIQNVETLRRDLDSQFEYRDKNKLIRELDDSFNNVKKLDAVRDKLLEEFNKKHSTNITTDDTKINLSGKNLKKEDLKKFCQINLENIKELILSNNDLTSIKNLFDANLDNLEILKVDHNRINSVEILPFLKCHKLKELHLNDNKLCNVESLAKMKDFKAMELIDLSNNLFDQKLESNQKLIQELQQMAKTVKISEEGKEGDISDEDLKSLLKSTIKK